MNLLILIQVEMKVSFVKDYPGLGDRLRRARQQMDLSVGDVAKMTGISGSQINRIESEDVKIAKAETVAKIAAVVRVNFWEH